MKKVDAPVSKSNLNTNSQASFFATEQRQQKSEKNFEYLPDKKEFSYFENCSPRMLEYNKQRIIDETERRNKLKEMGVKKISKQKLKEVFQNHWDRNDADILLDILGKAPQKHWLILV